MWPQTLQMTRDECRGILRRLELESYSHVVSVFRAQGGLNEPKVKLLEELRNVFHISVERHRAEARRVANDEQLSTIAEAISGPNTWQEWAREGRRAYPLLPRVDPQTALTIIANDIAAKVRSENEKLPLPEDTALAAAVDAANYLAIPKVERAVHFVNEEPFKMPEIPLESKKGVKRNNPDGTNSTTNKKRYTHESGAAVNAPKHITANDSDVLLGLSKEQSKRLQQQRFFHHQYQKHKQKVAAKKAAAAANHAALATSNPNVSTKRQNVAGAKNSRRAQKLLQRQFQQQQLHQQMLLQQQQAMLQTQLHSPPPPTQQSNNTIVNNSIVYGGGATNDVQPIEFIEDELKPIGKFKTTTTTLQHIDLTTSPRTTKTLISTTPVQKYIVEDRPGTTTSSLSQLTATTHLSSPTSQQIVTQLPAPGTKLRTAILPPGTKITKKFNAHTAGGPIILDQATIIEGTTINTGGKTLKPLASGVRVLPFEQQQQQPQQHTNSNISKLPTVNINAGNLKDKSIITTATTPVQKYIVEDRQVAATSLTPTILSPAATPSTVSLNIIKNLPASSLNNTLITPLTPTSTTTTTTVFRKAPTNIIKTLNVATAAGATAASTSTASGNFNVTSNTTNTPIIASGITSGAPQILSNIKLASASPQTAAVTAAQFNLKHVPTNAIRTGVKLCHSPNGKVFLQPTNLSEATKAKIQSSFTQKVNATMLPSGSNILNAGAAGTTLGTAGAITPTSPSAGQRFSIQKVQFLSGPMISNANNSGGASGSASGVTKPTTLTIGGSKGNVIFQITKSGALSSFVPSKQQPINAESVVSAKPPNFVVIGPNTPTTAKTNANLAVTAAAAATAAPSALTVSSSAASNNQLITEDTPVDIINMPFIVDDGAAGESGGGVVVAGGGNDNTAAAATNSSSAMMKQTKKNVVIPETLNLLNTPRSNIVTTAAETKKTTLSKAQQRTTSEQQQQQQPQQQPVLVLGATDWEMELDQAAKVTTKITTHNDEQSLQITDCNSDIIIDESFEDCIEEEIVVADGIDDIGSVVVGSSNNEQNQIKEQNKKAQTTTTSGVTQQTHAAAKSHIGEVIEIDENTAVEYVDMDLEQPMQEQQQEQQQSCIEIITSAAAATATPTTTTTTDNNDILNSAAIISTQVFDSTAVATSIASSSSNNDITVDIKKSTTATPTTTTTIAQSNITQ